MEAFVMLDPGSAVAAGLGSLLTLGLATLSHNMQAWMRA
jgi:hypothetical protein